MSCYLCLTIKPKLHIMAVSYHKTFMYLNHTFCIFLALGTFKKQGPSFRKVSVSVSLVNPFSLTLKIKSAGSPETSVSTYDASWCQNPENYSLNVLCSKTYKQPRFKIYSFVCILIFCTTCLKVTVIPTAVGMKKSIMLSCMTTSMYIATILHYVCVPTYAGALAERKACMRLCVYLC